MTKAQTIYIANPHRSMSTLGPRFVYKLAIIGLPQFRKIISFQGLQDSKNIKFTTIKFKGPAGLSYNQDNPDIDRKKV